MSFVSSYTTAQQYQQHRRHPQLFQGNFKEEWVHPDLRELVQAAQTCTPKESNDDDAHFLGLVNSAGHSVIRKEAPQVFSFYALSDDFVRLLNEELTHFYEIAERENITIRRPNSMNNYGVILNEIGLKETISSLQQQYIWPISRHLFPVQGSSFDDHHSFIVRYNADEDLGLDMHMDDSDVTFNVCLGEPGFTKATLTFCGNFGKPDHRKLVANYQHEIARAVLHLGTRRHGADDIESGTRVNMIVWNHNHQYRASKFYEQERHSKSAYMPEESPPDPMCLSYTHDRDYLVFKKLPKTVQGKRFRGWCPPPGKEYPGFPNA